jgi:flagellar motor component MotA
MFMLPYLLAQAIIYTFYAFMLQYTLAFPVETA